MTAPDIPRPSRNFALYAVNRRLGQPTEHRNAGARLGRVGVLLRYRLPVGWSATVYAGPLAFEVTLKAGDARFDEWLDLVWPRASRHGW